MVSVYQLKPAFQGWLRPVTRRLAAARVSANQVTLAALALSLIAGIAIALFPEMRWPLLLLPLVLLARMALNAIDGMLAREHDMKTRLGAERAGRRVLRCGFVSAAGAGARRRRAVDRRFNLAGGHRRNERCDRRADRRLQALRRPYG